MARKKVRKEKPDGLNGPTKTRIELARRREEVERVMTEGMWSLSVVRQLAERHGVSNAQIYSDRKRIIDLWQKQVVNVEHGDLKAEWVHKVRRMTNSCMQDGHTIAAMKGVALEGKALGVFEPFRIEVHNINEINPGDMAREIIEALPLIQQVANLTTPELTVIDTVFEETE